MDGIDQNSDKWLLNNFFVDEHTLDYYMSKIKVLIYVISKLKYQSGMEWLWDKVQEYRSILNLKLLQKKLILQCQKLKQGFFIKYHRFFTDIGSSYFLPKLKKNLGLYLGLTGFPLKGY